MVFAGRVIDVGFALPARVVGAFISRGVRGAAAIRISNTVRRQCTTAPLGPAQVGRFRAFGERSVKRPAWPVELNLPENRVLQVAEISPATAHCPDPGNNGYRYVWGSNERVVRAARANIEWPGNPDLCSSGAFYSVNITRSAADGSDTGWVQVGHGAYHYYTRNLGYCERNPRNVGTGTYQLSEYTVPQQAQLYTYAKNTNDQFECRINGETLRYTAVGWLGMTSGNWNPVQAEAQARHVQLGYINPAWLDFTNAERTLDSETTFADMSINNVQRDDTIYHWRQSDMTGFGVNTDANH